MAGKVEREVLLKLGFGPDFGVWPANASAQLDYIHRRNAGEDIYFLRNTGSNQVRFEAMQFGLTESQLPPRQRVLLDLGEVREVARVYLNGREAGLSSFAPHVLDVTQLLRTGENSLVVEVANTWLNRLIADDALPDGRRKTHTNIPGPVAGQRWRDAQPMPSGLLGPVRVRFPGDIQVNITH